MTGRAVLVAQEPRGVALMPDELAGDPYFDNLKPPKSGGPEYPETRSYMVKHMARERYAVVARRTSDAGNEYWQPMLYGTDPTELAVAAAQSGLGNPVHLTLQNSGSSPDLAVAWIAGENAVQNWAASEAQKRVQAIAQAPVYERVQLTPDEIRELHEDLHLDARHEMRRGHLNAELNEQLHDLEATLRAQRQLQNQAAQVLDDWSHDASRSPEDVAMARAEYDRQREITKDLDARAELIDGIVNGPRHTPDVPVAAFDDEQLSLDLEAGLDALAQAVAKHDPNGPEPDDPEAHAEPAKPKNPTGPGDTGAEATPEATAMPDHGYVPEAQFEAEATATPPQTQSPEARAQAEYEAKLAHWEAMNTPGYVSPAYTPEVKAETLAYAEAQLGARPGATPIEEMAKLDPLAFPGSNAAIIASRAFPDAHAAATDPARATMQASARPRAKSARAAKVLKRGRR